MIARVIELEKVRKDVVLMRYYAGIFSGGTEDIHEKPQSEWPVTVEI
jgi:hypothetical protein